jgi:hypothetical protein
MHNIDSFPAAIHSSVRTIVAERIQGKSYWWSVEHDTGATEFHCTAGLPPEAYFSVLLGGAQATSVPLDPLQALESTSTR